MFHDPPRLLDDARAVARVRHLSYVTEKACLRYIRFHGIIHPATLDASHVASFLTHLATARNVAAKTQQQAFNAVAFLCRDVLRQPVAEPIAARPVRAEAVGWEQRRSAVSPSRRRSNFGP